MSHKVPEFPPIPSDRIRLFYVPEDYILFLFSNGMLKAQCVNVPAAMNLPATAIVKRTWLDEQRRSFGFLVEDESFDPVPQGSEVPLLIVTWAFIPLQIETKTAR